MSDRKKRIKTLEARIELLEQNVAALAKELGVAIAVASDDAVIAPPREPATPSHLSNTDVIKAAVEQESKS